jgi:hypothetical protein
MRSLGDLFKAQTRIWIVGFFISVLAVFSSNITEKLKLALNSADLRSKSYEELAVSLSEFNFEAELIVEYIGNGWTDETVMTPIIKDYNDAVTKLRGKEYVYLSWVKRYWGQSKLDDLEATYASVKTFDTAIHGLNDEFEAVNVAKSKKKVDQNKAEQALVRLRPALGSLQEQSKKLLIELQ